MSKIIKTYILDLDKPRELRFGFKSLRMLREKFGDKSIEQLMNIQVDEIPIIVLAGLQWEEKELTLEKVEDLLDAAIPEKFTILGVTTTALEALAAQMGVDTKKILASDQEKKVKKKKPIRKTLSSRKRKPQH